MISEPVTLSEVAIEGSKRVLNLADDYSIEFPDAPALAICFGQTETKRFDFNHANVAATKDTTFEFKHYEAGGGKHWTRKPGRQFWFVVPSSKIRILPEKGYSYVRAEINGVAIRFNVSGGTWGPGWRDWVNDRPHVLVGHTLRDMKKIADVALPNQSLTLSEDD